MEFQPQDPSKGEKKIKEVYATLSRDMLAAFRKLEEDPADEAWWLFSVWKLDFTSELNCC